MVEAHGHEHTPVLVTEVLDGLDVRPDGIYLDATFGRGGHSRALLARLGPEARVIAIDRDPQSVSRGRALAASRTATSHGPRGAARP